MTMSATQSPEIAFDAAVDLTECHCGFFAKSAHAHAACCGADVIFHDGGRELDGTQYYEIDDALFVRCSDCRDVYLCKEHARHIEADKPLCGYCYHEQEGKAHDTALLETGLANACEDIADSCKRMLCETDLPRLESLDIQLGCLQTIIQTYRVELSARLASLRQSQDVA